MAKKSVPVDENDLLAGVGDDPLSDAAPAKTGKSKPAAKEAVFAAKAAKPAAKAAAAPAAKPAKAPKAPKEEATERTVTERGAGKFYMDADERADLAKKISANKKPISTKDLAAKYETDTWKVRRAINEVLVPDGKGSVEKVGNSLVYTPA